MQRSKLSTLVLSAMNMLLVPAGNGKVIVRIGLEMAGVQIRRANFRRHQGFPLKQLILQLKQGIKISLKMKLMLAFEAL